MHRPRARPARRHSEPASAVAAAPGARAVTGQGRGSPGPAGVSLGKGRSRARVAGRPRSGGVRRGPGLTGPVFAGGYFSGEQAGRTIENAILDLCSQVSRDRPSRVPAAQQRPQAGARSVSRNGTVCSVRALREDQLRGSVSEPDSVTRFYSRLGHSSLEHSAALGLRLPEPTPCEASGLEPPRGAGSSFSLGEARQAGGGVAARCGGPRGPRGWACGLGSGAW